MVPVSKKRAKYLLELYRYMQNDVHRFSRLRKCHLKQFLYKAKIESKKLDEFKFKSSIFFNFENVRYKSGLGMKYFGTL